MWFVKSRASACSVRGQKLAQNYPSYRVCRQKKCWLNIGSFWIFFTNLSNLYYSYISSQKSNLLYRRHFRNKLLLHTQQMPSHNYRPRSFYDTRSGNYGYLIYNGHCCGTPEGHTRLLDKTYLYNFKIRD